MWRPKTGFGPEVLALVFVNNLSCFFLFWLRPLLAAAGYIITKGSEDGMNCVDPGV